MSAPRQKHFYWLEKLGREGGDAVKLSRATLTPKGWMESGSKEFQTADAARSVLPRGLVRSWPPSYGGTQVIEWWSEPEETTR